MSRLFSMDTSSFLTFQALSTVLNKQKKNQRKNKWNKDSQRLTSHLRSKVEVFVNAFFPRNIVANFLAAIRIGSESLEDFLIKSK